MNLVARLLDAHKYLRGSWKSTHRATGDLCLDAAKEIDRLRQGYHHLSKEHPQSFHEVGSFARKMLILEGGKATYYDEGQ